MRFKKEYLKLDIVERLEKLRVVCYEDGILGSSSGTYYGTEDYMNIKSEDDLECIVYDESDFNEIYFDEWFDKDDFEVVDNGDGGEYGYGKLIVDKENKSIKVMVVPCIFGGFSDIRIFGFDWKSGELIKEISDEKVKELLSKNKKLYCG